MKYFIDTEFVDTGTLIELISIGIVASDGREYYAQSEEFLLNGQTLLHDIPNPWIEKNVIPHLGNIWVNRVTISREIRAFMDVEKYGTPELYGWCCGYDFVILCQLYGTMMNIPAGWPHYMRDLQFVMDKMGIDDSVLPPQEGKVHNALHDARYIKEVWDRLKQYEDLVTEPTDNIDAYNRDIEVYNRDVDRWNNEQ